MKTGNANAPTFILVALTLLVAATAHALPRYSARYGQACILCHENPTGGGLRSEYATQYLVPQELAASGAEDEPFPSLLNDRILLGADLRTLAHREEGGRGGLLAMQSDVYLSARLSGSVTAYVERGTEQ